MGIVSEITPAKKEALLALSRWWSLIPVHPNSKKPKGEWKLAQTQRANVEKVEAMFQTRDANYGIVTGKISGIAVLDIDAGSGGIDSVRDIFGDEWPVTPTLQTPGGGYHLYFQYPDSGVRNSAGTIGAGLDIRGGGGCVVGAGSVRDGRSYRWVDDLSPEEVPLAPFPESLITQRNSLQDELVSTEVDVKTYRQHNDLPVASIGVVPEEFHKRNTATKEVPPVTSEDWFAEAIGGVEKGRRDSMAPKVWGKLAQAGLSPEAILPMMQAYADRCKPPWIPEEDGGKTLAEKIEYWTAQYPNPSDVLPIVNEVTGEIITPLERAYQRMGLVSPADWLSEPEQEQKWVIDGLLPVGTLVMASAFPKVGKSVFTRHMALAVAKGEPFLDREVEQGSVIYLALEENQDKVKRSFRNLGMTETTPLRLKVSQPHSDAVDDLVRIVEAEKPRLVVLDTVTRMPKAKFEMADYFGNSEWLTVYLWLAHETGTTIVVNYHSSRKGSQLEGADAIMAPLGSTGIMATTDQTITIKKESDYSRSFSSSGRYEEIPPTQLSFDKETERLGVVGEKSQLSHQRIRQDIMDAIEGDTWQPQRETLDRVTGDAKGVLTALNELIDQGIVERQGRGMKGSAYQIRKILFPVSPLGVTEQTGSEEYPSELEWED